MSEEKKYEYRQVFAVRLLDAIDGGYMKGSEVAIHLETFEEAEKYIQACDPDKKYSWEIEHVGILPIEYVLASVAHSMQEFLKDKPITNKWRDRSHQIRSNVVVW